MKITYENEEELEEEGDAIAFQNDERLDLGCDSDSSADEQMAAAAATTSTGYNTKPKGTGGVPRYASEAKKFDMSEIDNHYRFL